MSLNLYEVSLFSEFTQSTINHHIYSTDEKIRVDAEKLGKAMNMSVMNIYRHY